VADSSSFWKGRGFDFLSGKRIPFGPRKPGELRHPQLRARLKRSTRYCDVGILFPLRLYHPNLTCGGYYKTTSPLADIFLLKQFCDPLNQTSPFRRAKTQKQDPVVRARCEPPQVREIQVLSDQESRFLLRCFPNLSVCTAQKEFTMAGGQSFSCNSSMRSFWFMFFWYPTLPAFGRVGVLTSFLEKSNPPPFEHRRRIGPQRQL